MQRQLNETHAEVMRSGDPESHDDDSPGALGDPDWTTQPGMLGKRGEPSTKRSHNFDSSTCAAGEQETPCFETVSF